MEKHSRLWIGFLGVLSVFGAGLVLLAGFGLVLLAVARGEVRSMLLLLGGWALPAAAQTWFWSRTRGLFSRDQALVRQAVERFHLRPFQLPFCYATVLLNAVAVCCFSYFASKAALDASQAVYLGMAAIAGISLAHNVLVLKIKIVLPPDDAEAL